MQNGTAQTLTATNGPEAAPVSGPGRLTEPARLATVVTRWIEASETVFLDVGSRLQGVHGRISAVRNGIARSTEILATPDMARMRTDLSSAVESSRGIARLVDDRRTALDALQSALDEAAEGGTAVQFVFRTLDYIVLIARAQIGGMTSGQEELIPFASRVHELVASGDEVGRFIEDRMRILHSILGESRSIEAGALASGTEPGLADGFLGLIALIENQQSAVGARRAEAQEAFTAVWKAIGGVVMGLQAHDNARQRFEHSARNLSLVETLAATGHVEAGDEPLSERSRTAAVRRILALETAQLDDLAATYAAKMGALDADLGVIAAELETCGAVLDRLRPVSSGNEGLKALDEQASRLRLGFRDGDAQRQRLGESLEKSVEATASLADMTAKLDDLEYDLRLAGFNAAVRAAHVEGGDETIGYIAGVIREQALRAREEAERVRRGIARATASTRCLSGEILPAVTAAEQSIEAALDEASMRLSRAELDCGEALGQSVAAADGLGAEIAIVREMMRSHEEGHQLMQALSSAVAALAASLPEAELSPEEAERLDRFLVAPYTMEEERAVFQRAIGRLPGTPLPAPGGDGDAPAPATRPPATPAAPDDLDDIFF